MTAIVTRGNAADLHLPDESVDLVVTSPPYFGLRSYQDGGEHYSGQVGDEATPTEYLDALIRCTAEWMRVLKPGGSIFVNLGDKYAQPGKGERTRHGVSSTTAKHGDGVARHVSAVGQSYGEVRGKSLMLLPQRYAIRCIDDLGLILRAEIVWAKPNGLPESVTDRVRRSHEVVFHFVKQPRYFSAVDEIREPSDMNNPRERYAKRHAADVQPRRDDAATKAVQGHGFTWASNNPLGKLPGSVWNIPTSPLRVPESLGIDHFAAYPPELVRRIVLGWSPRDGVVLDPFMGTGTTCLVASCFGRVGIGVDLSADYVRLARWRTTDPGERARVLGVDKPATPVVGQIDMFGELTA